MLENAFYESFCMLYAIYIYSRTNLGGGGNTKFQDRNFMDCWVLVGVFHIKMSK